MIAAAGTAEGDDVGLIAQIALGNVAAFEALYDRYYVRANRLARGVCYDDGRAEESVQEAFMSVWRKPESYRVERGSVATWLLTIVRHRAVDVARADAKHSRRRAEEHQGLERDGPGDIADRVEAKDDAGRLTAQLAQLPEAQQEVIALAFYGELTHVEIAAQLGLPQGTVKGRMRLGLNKLRVDIDQVDASERWRVALAFAFYSGDLDQARRIMRDASRAMPVVTMLDDVLAPAMHAIGGLWERGEITIADEHLATATAHRLLAEISVSLQIAPAKTRETIVLIATGPERHTFGLLMANDVLAGAGYETVLLGGGIPEAALSAALLRHQPEIVGLSSTIFSDDALATTATVVHRALPAAKIVAGGAAANRLPRGHPAHYVERLDGLLAALDAILRT